MTRLHRSACSEPGFSRPRRGRGLEVLDHRGRVVADPEVLERVKALVIPPAWQDVWICRSATGHLQSVGTDAAGRRQYLYHPDWRGRRDRQKFERMTDFARWLPAARRRVDKALRAGGQARLGREQVLAAAFRLLDRGLFRVGGESYARDNGSFGLATLARDAVVVRRSGEMVFCFPAKSGQAWESRLVDAELVPVVRALKARRERAPELLAYRNGSGGWHDVTSADINEHVKDLLGEDYSGKDFRTWHATVLAAVGLAVSAPAAERAEAGRRRAVARVVREVADYLGNTPAVCRRSYIDPRVVDRFHAGETIEQALGSLGAPERPEGNVKVEAAVLRLIEGR